MKKEIICGCCHKKLLAKQREDGKIYVWCKECRKEVELEIVQEEANEIHIPPIKIEAKPYT